MKYLIVFAFLLPNYFSASSQNGTSHSLEADSILLKTDRKLSSLKNIRYTNTRELNYSSEHYLNTSNWNVYYDFQTTDTITGFKYQIDDSASKQVFNGTEKFDLDKKAKTIQVNDRPNKKSFAGISALYNSIITLKNVLPLLIADKTAIKEVNDTSINNTVYSLVTINIGKRRIQNLGNEFDAMTTKSNFIYKMIIDKSSYLPVAILQKNDRNNDFIKTSFTNVEINTSSSSEMSWYYSSYSTDYKPAAETATHLLLSKGSLPPEWKLKIYNEDKMIALSDLKGKVILLDFWIKNCGPCIQSVPHLNELQDKFEDKDFKIISINSYDSKDDASWFCNKHKTKYTVLLNGKPVAEQYGVTSFPTFFVIDKMGRIIYSNVGYNGSVQSNLEQVIQKAL